MKTYKLVVLFVLAMGANFFAMADSPPSPDIGEKYLQEKIDSDSQKQIKLVSFKKTDGLMSVVNAVQNYELDFEAEIEFQTYGTWLKGLDGPPIGFGFSAGQVNPLQNPLAAQGAIIVYRSDRVKLQVLCRA